MIMRFIVSYVFPLTLRRSTFPELSCRAAMSLSNLSTLSIDAQETESQCKPLTRFP